MERTISAVLTGNSSSSRLQVKEMESETPGITESLRNAKLLLKKSKRVDYYKLLEINQDANDYDIKKVGCRCRQARGSSKLMQYLKAISGGSM